MQHRLLLVLQEREITPVGSTRAVPIDVRVVAATNRDLRAEMEAGRFRDDLYYRLNVVRIELPPLRARKEDIPLLADAFFREVDRRPHSGCSPLAMRLLQGHTWPGNVRELFGVLESDFPALVHAMDKHAWLHLALGYVTRYPSEHPNLNVLNRRLPGSCYSCVE